MSQINEEFENYGKEGGIFCEVFGNTPRNRILEFFLTMRTLEYSIGDIALETSLSRASAYNIMGELIKRKIIIPTRKSSGAQLYMLNIEDKEVQLLLKIDNILLDKLFEEYEEKYGMKVATTSKKKAV